MEKLRAHIDRIDKTILKALAERKRFEQKIGAHKRSRNIQFLDTKRRATMLAARITEGKKMDLPMEFIDKLFRLIHAHSLSVQKGGKAKS